MEHVDALFRILLYTIALGFAIRNKHWPGYLLAMLLIAVVIVTNFTAITATPSGRELLLNVAALAIMHYIVYTSLRSRR